MPEFRLNYEFIKARYDAELARKDALTAQLGLPVTVLLALGGATVAMVQGLSYSNEVLNTVFIALIAIAGVYAARALYFFAKAYHGQTYNQLPPMGAMYEYLQQNIAYFEEQQYEEADAVEAAEKELEDNLRFRFTSAIDQNLTSNNNRLQFMHEAIVALFVVIVFVGAAAIPYGVDRIIAPPEVPVVHLDNLDTARPVEKGATMPDQKPAPVASQPQAPTPTAKPSFPSNIVTKSDRPVSTRGK